MLENDETEVPKPPKAPKGLQKGGHALWRAMWSVFAFREEPHLLTILEQACRTRAELDRLESEMEGQPYTVVAAIGATLPGAAWQRCRTHYAVNLMAITPKSSRPWVRTLLHSIFDQPDAEPVVAQYDRVLDALAEKLPKVAEHLDAARAELLAFTAFPKQIWSIHRSGSIEKSGAEPTSWASSPTAPPSSASSEPC